MASAKMPLLLALFFVIAGCGNALNDLYPSGEDKSAALGKAPDFTLPDTSGNNIRLSTVIATPGVRGTVLYFTMWCTICQGQMDDIRSSLIPQYPDVRFFAVDYISGSVADAQRASGNFTDSFTVLVDLPPHVVQSLYNHATMGTTVVIDSTGTMRMNEEYKFSRLQTALAGLP